MIFLELMCAQNAYSLQARMLQDFIFHHKYILHLALISCADCIDFRVQMHAAKINRDQKINSLQGLVCKCSDACLHGECMC